MGIDRHAGGDKNRIISYKTNEKGRNEREKGTRSRRKVLNAHYLPGFQADGIPARTTPTPTGSRTNPCLLPLPTLDPNPGSMDIRLSKCEAGRYVGVSESGTCPPHRPRSAR